MLDLYTMSEADLAALLVSWGEKPFRAKQIRAWLYDRGATTPEGMTDLPRALRERLAAETQVGSMTIDTEQTSRDGTVKRLLSLGDGQLVESVLMPYQTLRRTACISTQAGCAMGCVFCATGQMGFARHLTAAEIVEQAARWSAELRQRGERLSNVVLMGMGEPFHNYDQTVIALRRLMSDLGIGARHITVSTVGLAPKIRQFADEGLQVGLAVSLHASSDETRDALMPINKRYPIDELISACREYAEKTHRRITFEWALIRDRNDDEATALRLARVLRDLPCHVNLIPLNLTGGYDGAPSDPVKVARFIEVLGQHGIVGTVRVRRGLDIDAGCGQLKSAVQKRIRPESPIA